MTYSHDDLDDALALVDELIGYSHLREKVRLRQDAAEYEWAERLVARADAIHKRTMPDIRQDAARAEMPAGGRDERLMP